MEDYVPETVQQQLQPPKSNATNDDSQSRYSSDVEQARRMMGSVSSAENRDHDNSNRTVANDNNTIIIDESDLDVGMRGLQRAKKYQNQGEHDSALKLYELSIEMLLKVLRASPKNPNKQSIERQINDALTAAEAIKSIIHHQNGSNDSSSNLCRRNQLRKPVSPFSGSLVKSLTARVKESIVNINADNKNGSSKTIIAKQQNNQQTQRQRQEQQIAAMGAETRALLDNFYVPTSDLQQTSWDDVAGLENVKRALQETAILPLIRPDLFTGLRKPQNILMYGPPGTGKTLLVRAMATESGSALFVCSAGVLTSKWMGEAEKTIKSVFILARHLAPAIIFLDEIDSVLSQRKDGEHEASRRFKTEFMVQVEGVSSATSDGHVLVVACTNCPWDIDGAVLRRFPRRILVPLPDEAARRGLIEYLLKKAGEHSITKRQVTLLVKRTDGFSGSDISALASEASYGPLRSIDMKQIATVESSSVRPIQYDDFTTVLDNTTRSVTTNLLQKYDDWQTNQAV